MKKKGFTLVELMVVVAIIAILAAVALPMYTRFKQKALANTACKITGGLTAPLQSYFDEWGTFVDLFMTPDANGNGQQLRSTNQNGDTFHAGANLASVQDLNFAWTGLTVTATSATVTWTWGASTKCPATLCDGTYCIQCIDSSDLNNTGCLYVIDLVSPELNLDRSSNADVTTC